MIKLKKAQSTLEYAILIIIIIGVFIAMQMYIKRGFQGRWKASMDDFGDQYDPRLVNSLTTFNMTVNSNTRVDTRNMPDASGQHSGYYTNRQEQSNMVETKNGYVAVGAFDSDPDRQKLLEKLFPNM